VSGPLSHVRVLDLSRVLAAPWAGQVLADLGADVVKVERPGAGDDTRAWGPPFFEDARHGRRDAGYFLAANRGKRSITLNLDKPAGRDIVRALAARSDVLLENYKVGTLARFGLGPEELRSANPRLVYCSVTGFGQSGPRSTQVAYDFLIQAMGGLMSITGERDGRPGGGPQKVGVPVVDLMTGMYAAVAVLAALTRREVSGRGEYIDMAMLDVQVAFLANQAMNYLLSGNAPRRTGNAHPNIQPQQVFACRDGEVVLVVGNDAQFAKLAEVLGRAAWARDARFATNAARVRHQDTLLPLISEALARFARSELVAKLDAAGVPCGPINSIPEAFADPQVVHRGMRVDVAGVPQVASPFRFAASPVAYDRPPPRLGEHSSEILRELGMGEAEIERLRAEGVL
jgi:crotonobetainyl-CoA:carnitine CoA-transferase CaiB-like acyl-CoA transferase